MWDLQEVDEVAATLRTHLQLLLLEKEMMKFCFSPSLRLFLQG